MNARQSQLTGRLRLRHLQEIHEAKVEEMAEDRGRFTALAGDAARPRVVSSFNLFQTPPGLAETLAQTLPRFGRTLEPSAGLGRLYKAVRAISPDCEIVLVEQSADCCRELYTTTEGDSAARLIQGDFLQQTPQELGYFDSIIMNPPFKMGTDIKHIEHAARFLNPGGRLAAICYNGPRQQKRFVEEEGYEFHPLPAGSFRSEGTGADTAIVIIDN